MSATNRAALIAKLHKVLKQHYKPVASNGQLPLLEQMLFACCLENAHYAKAEAAYQRLSTSFFDWNEVRVSTVKELAEAAPELPNPMEAASNLKRLLQTVFESTYSFDLEAIKKQNIGVGMKRLENFEGATPFVVAYATQQGLGGHAIPLDRGALEVLYIVGIASEAERASGNVAGLERAIPKNKGQEFASLLHQLAADFIVSPFSPAMKSLLLSVNADAKDRLPKRGQKKESAQAKRDGEKAAAKAAANKKGAAAAARTPEKGKAAKATAKGKESVSSKKKVVAKKTAAAQERRKSRATPQRPARTVGRKSPAKQLAKRKPR